jgi:hypothetical protein
MRTLAVAVAVATTLTACAPARSSEIQPQDVRFTKGRESVGGCTMLGVIDSRDQTNGGTVSQTPVERDPYRRLQMEAARLRANTVLLDEAPAGMGGNNTPGGRDIQGEAYRCSRPIGGQR